jgi:hypothetical protein
LNNRTKRPMKKLVILMVIVFLPAWMTLIAQNTTGQGQPKVEVYYFHATMRCPTCLAVEEQTRKTLDENFGEEMKAGTIKLSVLNFEEKENIELAEKFQVGWSSLILYVPESGKSVNLTEDAFANARTKPDEFRQELKDNIQKMLSVE